MAYDSRRQHHDREFEAAVGTGLLELSNWKKITLAFFPPLRLSSFSLSTHCTHCSLKILFVAYKREVRWGKTVG